MRLRLNDWRTRFGEEDVVRVEKTKEKRLVLRRTGFFVVFFVSPSVFHLPLQRVRVLQGRQANNGDQETTNSVDSTQKKEQRQKCEDRWRRVVVVVVCSSTTTTRKTKKGENGWFGRLRRSTVRSGVVCVLFFLKKWTTNVRSCGEETRGVVPSFCRRSAARPLVCGGDTSKRTSFVSGFAFLLERAEGGVSG